MDRPEDQTSELTPVRIRGKNARGRPQKRKLNEDSTAAEPSRPRGRPWKRLSTAVVLSPSHSTASSSVSDSTKRRRRGPKPPREVVLSPLELLPVELLQSIFLDSLNLSLPLCSPRLGSVLSSKHVKIALVTRAFCNCERYGNLVATESSDIDVHDRDLVEQYKSLQSGLLRLKWMTLDFFKECIDTFLVRIAARDFGAVSTKYGLEKPLPTTEDYHELLGHARFRDDACLRVPSSQDSSPRPVFYSYHPHSLERELPDARLLKLEMNRSRIALCIQMIESSANAYPYPDGPGPPGELSMFRCGFSGHIPTRLLHGPWTKERCEFLEILLEGDFSVDWLHTTCGETAEKGLEDAIREGNLRALGLLVNIAEYSYEGLEERVGADIEFRYGATVHEDEIMDYVQLWANSLWRVGVIPRTSHLRLAVIECDCPPDIVYHLLEADTSRVDLEDGDVVGWAVEKRKQGDWRGKWLLKLLRAAHRPRVIPVLPRSEPRAN